MHKYLDHLVAQAFKSFKDPDQPINIARLKNKLNIAELFNGPTLAFKVHTYPISGRIDKLEKNNWNVTSTL